MVRNPVDTANAEWSFRVALICQRFAGDILDADPEQLTQAIVTMVKTLPAVGSGLQDSMLRDRLCLTVHDAAHQFHAQFHREFPYPCDYRWRGGASGLDWRDTGHAAGVVLEAWGCAYLADFTRHHQWPASFRAASAIRESFAQPLVS